MGTRVHLYPRLFRACPVRVAKLLAVTHGDARAGEATKGALCSTRYRPLVGALGGGGGSGGESLALWSATFLAPFTVLLTAYAPGTFCVQYCTVNLLY